MDLESTNGTMLNGTRLEPARYIELKVDIRYARVTAHTLPHETRGLLMAIRAINSFIFLAVGRHGTNQTLPRRRGPSKCGGVGGTHIRNGRFHVRAPVTTGRRFVCTVALVRESLLFLTCVPPVETYHTIFKYR